jgi:hypothetical protein
MPFIETALSVQFSLGEACKQTLRPDVSAVVLRGAVATPDRFHDLMENGGNRLQTLDRFLDMASLRQAAQPNVVKHIGRRLGGSGTPGYASAWVTLANIEIHTVEPVQYRMQTLAKGYNPYDFDPERPIDEFRVVPGDIVIYGRAMHQRIAPPTAESWSLVVRAY